MGNEEWQLICRYVKDSSQPAFAMLVDRYVNLVYGSCLRQLRDRHLSEDVTQAVFLVLACKAKAISKETILSGWLFQVTRFACANALKVRARRRRHETAAAEGMASSLVVASTATEALNMDELKPLLDEAVNRLSPADRQAILLRFFQGHSVREVASEMGVSENAASQRLSRALTKLRSVFKKRGVVLPAGTVATAIVAASADQAPAAVRSGADAAGHLGAVNTATSATLIAMKVMKTMIWNSIRPFALTCLALVIALATGAVVLNRSVGQPGSTTAANTTSANVLVCTWEVAIDPKLSATIRTLCTSVATDSRGYEAMKCDGDRLVEALRNGQSAKLLPVLGHQVNFMRPDISNGWPDGFPISAGTMGLLTGPGVQRGVFFSNSNGKLLMDIRKGLARLNITVDNANAKLQAGATPELAGTIHFKGDLKAGEAIVFMGHVGPFNGFEVDHLVIWQTVAATEDEAPFVQAIGQSKQCQQWIDEGPHNAVAIARDAATWSAGRPAPGTGVAAKWVHTLPNGGIATVLGVSQPIRRPFQWWDADGNAIAAPVWPRLDADLEVAVSVDDPSVLQRGPMDSNSETEWTDSAGKHAVFFVPISATDDGPVRLTMGFGAGRWTEVAVFKQDQPVVAGLATYTLRKIQPDVRKTANSEGLIQVEMDYTDLPDIEMTLAAVQKDGKTVLFDARPLPLWVQPEQPTEHEFSGSCWVDIDDLDHLVVKTRPRQWTTFDGIAGDSKNTPMAQPKAPTSAPSATAGSPEAAMAAMQTAVRAGDIKGVEASFYAPNQLALQFCDLQARLAIAGMKLALAAQARFGTDAEGKVLKDQQYLPSLSTTEETKWQVTGDTAHPLDTDHVKFVGPGLRRVNGVWKTDFTLPTSVTNDQYKQQAAAMEPIIGLLNDLAKATAAGKYHDAYEVRDALEDGLKSQRSK